MKFHVNKKIVCFNVIFLLIIYVVSETYFYNHFYKESIRRLNIQNASYWHKSSQDILSKIMEDENYPDRFHYLEKKYDKDPILFIGCSYTYGQELNEEENLPGRISKITSRPIYNLGLIGADAAVALMLTERFSKDKNITQKPKYVIYTYMFHHLQRLLNWEYFDLYRQKGYLPFQKYSPLYHSYTYSYFKNRQLDEYFWNDWDYNKYQKIFFAIMKDIKKITDTIYPDSKFVVLIYNDINYDLTSGLWDTIAGNGYKMNKLFEIQESEEFRKEFEKLGITVITTQELIGRKMDRPEDRVDNDVTRPHPSAKAWELIAPKLVERLKL